MKRPIWVFNLSILALFAALLVIIATYHVKLPPPYKITIIEPTISDVAQKIEAIDVSRIYSNDLFGTYQTAAAHEEKATAVQPVPPPPPAIQVTPPPIEEPKFLDPLAVTLTGVFMLHNDTENRAVILDNATKAETTYKVGDMIYDAQLVKIFATKAMFIRSNGQQELLYLNQDDATADNLGANKKTFNQIVQKTSESHYLVDTQEFASQVKSLNNVIDLFDISTAYKRGLSIGVKVGKIPEQSLPAALGFEPGDIITKINSTTPTITKKRLAIYNELINLPDNKKVTVELTRHGTPIILTYTLGIVEPIPTPMVTDLATASPELKKATQTDAEKQKLKLLQQKEKFAPTLQDLRLKEKENILKHQKAMQAKKDAAQKETNKG